MLNMPNLHDDVRVRTRVMHVRHLYEPAIVHLQEERSHSLRDECPVFSTLLLCQREDRGCIEIRNWPVSEIRRRESFICLAEPERGLLQSQAASLVPWLPHSDGI